jgi:hypothetical protein
VSSRDPDARVTMKRTKAHFGYKAHRAAEEDSGLVRQDPGPGPISTAASHAGYFEAKGSSGRLAPIRNAFGMGTQ